MSVGKMFVTTYNVLSEAMSQAGHTVHQEDQQTRRKLLIKTVTDILEKTDILALQEVGRSEYADLKKVFDESNWDCIYKPMTDFLPEDKFWESRDGYASLLAVNRKTVEILDHEIVNLYDADILPDEDKGQPLKELKRKTIIQEWKSRFSPLIIAHVRHIQNDRNRVVVAGHLPCTWYCRAFTNLACVALDYYVGESRKKYDDAYHAIVAVDANFGMVTSGKITEAYGWLLCGAPFSKDLPWKGSEFLMRTNDFHTCVHNGKTTVCKGKHNLFSDSLDHIWLQGMIPVEYTYYVDGKWGREGMVEPAPNAKNPSDHCPVRMEIY